MAGKAPFWSAGDLNMNREFDIYLGIPAEGLDYISDIPCTREDEALAVAFGVYLCGKSPRVFMQDSGWIDSLNCVLSLWFPYVQNFSDGVDSVIHNKTEPEHHVYTSLFFQNFFKRINTDVFEAGRRHIYDNATR